MFTATMWCDIQLGDLGSLKAKRSVIKPLVSELRRRYAIAVAEVGSHELYRRTELGMAAVASTAAQVRDVLDECERFVAERPDIVLLSVHRQLIAASDN